MLKLIQNLFAGESDRESAAKTVAIQPTSPDSLESQITQADILWQQGKLGEAIVVYRQAIEQHPESQEIYQHLSALLKQQGNIAEAYEKLAVGLKDSGEIEQAASYYRQAIGIKALTGDTKQKLLPNSLQRRKDNTDIPELRTEAFSFQPLSHSAVQQSLARHNMEVKDNNRNAHKLETISPEQTINIDWETAQVYLQQALDLCDTKEWEAASNACRKAIAIVPDLAEAYKILGNTLQRMGKTAEAMQCYAKAVEIKPDLAEVYAGIGDIYLKQQRWQQAIEYYQKAIIIKPNAQIYRSAAYVWQQLGQSEKARINLQKALELEGNSPAVVNELNPKNNRDRQDNLPANSVEIYQQIAEKLIKQSRWQEAAIYYRKALELSVERSAKTLPSQEDRDRQLISAKQQRPPNIAPEKQDLSPARSSSPSLAATSNPSSQQQSIIQDLDLLNSKIDRSLQPVKAREDRQESQLDKAIRRYYQQVELNPNSAIAHCNLGNLYARKKQWNLAILCYEQAVKLDPQYAAARLNLARTFARVGEQGKFLKQMKMALKLQPNIASAIDRFYFGNALYKQNQPEEAIKSYYKAIIINPYFVQAYHRLGEVLNKQGKQEDATEFYQKAIEYNPEDAELHFALGQQFFQQQNWNSAVKIYGKVLELDPRFPNASTQLNRALAEKLKLDLANRRR